MPVLRQAAIPIPLTPAQKRYQAAQNPSKYTTKRTIKKKRKKL